MTDQQGKGLIEKLQEQADQQANQNESDNVKGSKEDTESNQDSQETSQDDNVADISESQAIADAVAKSNNANLGSEQSTGSTNDENQVENLEGSLDVTPDDEQQAQIDEQQLSSMKDDSTSSTTQSQPVTKSDKGTTSKSSSGTDIAMTSQGQQNLKKSQQKQPDFQDIESPNLFIVRAKYFHSKATKLLEHRYYTHTLNANAVNSIIGLGTESFKNLCRGFSKIIEDNNRRNNQVEARTEHLQKQASEGAKTIKIWQDEGIFANLQDELQELSDVLHDPRFLAFAKSTKTANLTVPKTLKVKGAKATEKVKKFETQQKQKKGSKQK